MPYLIRYIVFLVTIVAVYSGNFPLTKHVPLPMRIDFAKEIYKARQKFNGEMLKALDHRSNGKTNIIVSLFGIHSALSSLMTGAPSDSFTFGELWNALGYESTWLDQEMYLDANFRTLKNITELEQHGLSFASLLAVDQGMNLKQGFEDLLFYDFGTHLQQENFKENPKQATENINGWVNSVTNGKIKKLFEPLDSDTRAVIANALHFKSKWFSLFDKSSSFKGKFKLVNKTTKDVMFMKIESHKLKRSKYTKHPGFQSIQIPFNNRLWFGIMLPDNVIDKNFDCCTNSTHLIQNRENKRFHLTMPKFAIEQSHNAMEEILKEMGVKEAFGKDADFSDISDEGLFVSRIAHKATIEVDEDGVEASAATGIEITTKSLAIPSPETMSIVVDRPFIFTISDSNSNVDLFTGIVYEP